MIHLFWFCPLFLSVALSHTLLLAVPAWENVLIASIKVFAGSKRSGANICTQTSTFYVHGATRIEDSTGWMASSLACLFNVNVDVIVYYINIIINVTQSRSWHIKQFDDDAACRVRVTVDIITSSVVELIKQRSLKAAIRHRHDAGKGCPI